MLIYRIMLTCALNVGLSLFYCWATRGECGGDGIRQLVEAIALLSLLTFFVLCYVSIWRFGKKKMGKAAA